MIYGQTTEQFQEPKRWYAWYPVTLDDGRSAWLEWVWYRPRNGVYPPGPFISNWRYSLESPCRAGYDSTKSGVDHLSPVVGDGFGVVVCPPVFGSGA